MLAIFEWLEYDIPAEERLRLIKNAGFDGVMLYWNNDNDERLNKLKCAEKHGLFIENIHTAADGTANDLVLDNLNGEARFAYLAQCIEDCADYRIPAMVVHPAEGFDAPPVNALALNRIKRLSETAERRGVKIAFENTSAINNLYYILDNVDSLNIGLCYDSGHVNCRTPGIDLLTKYGPRLMSLHLHDNMGYIEGKREEDMHLLPFDGTVDWPELMDSIRRTGYRGAISLEAVGSHYGHMTPEEFLRVAFERAEKLSGSET